MKKENKNTLRTRNKRFTEYEDKIKLILLTMGWEDDDFEIGKMKEIWKTAWSYYKNSKNPLIIDLWKRLRWDSLKSEIRLSQKKKEERRQGKVICILVGMENVKSDEDEK